MRYLFYISLILGFGSSQSLSQCVRSEVMVARLQGHVYVSPIDEPLSEVRITVLPRDPANVKPIAEVVTDELGRFDLPQLNNGKYILSITYPDLDKIVTRLSIVRQRKGSESLRITLAVPDFAGTDSCEGDIRVIRKAVSNARVIN
jgi:hypothetical protein